MLRVYRKVRDGTKPVREVANDPVQTELKLVGLIKPRADGCSRSETGSTPRSSIRRGSDAPSPPTGGCAVLSVSVALLLLTPAAGTSWSYPASRAQIRQPPRTFQTVARATGNLPAPPPDSVLLWTADAEWAAFGLKRMQRAISNDSSFLDPLIRRDAYRLIHDAWRSATI